MNVLFKTAYLGTPFHGSQIQKNANSVCGEIKTALETLLRHKVAITTCSRTDTGVHAREFFLTFKTNEKPDFKKLVYAVNSVTPKEIAILGAKRVPDSFNPMYAAKSKQYCYIISTAEDPFMVERACFYRKPVDIERMSAAAKYFLGTHDFSTFCSKGGTIENKTRTIKKLEIKKSGKQVKILIEADGFLYNMVRIIVGTLLDVNEKKIQPEDISRIIAAKNRSFAGKTAPAEGLYLFKVKY